MHKSKQIESVVLDQHLGIKITHCPREHLHFSRDYGCCAPHHVIMHVPENPHHTLST